MVVRRNSKTTNQNKNQIQPMKTSLQTSKLYSFTSRLAIAIAVMATLLASHLPGVAGDEPGRYINNSESSRTATLRIYDRLGAGQVEESLVLTIGEMSGRLRLTADKPEGYVDFPGVPVNKSLRVSLQSRTRFDSGEVILGSGVSVVRLAGYLEAELVSLNHHFEAGDGLQLGLVYRDR